VREAAGATLRVDPLRKPKSRHLVDIRQVGELAAFGRVDGIAVLDPAELTTLKAIAAAERVAQEKGLSDRLDLARLLRTFPALRADEGEVARRLRAR
jgi:hypothetical protein